MITTLTDFLLARIAEDQEDLCHCCDMGLGSRIGFARAELDAKRRIVALYSDDFPDPNYNEAAYRAMLALALPYADHPDYREEWRP